MYDLIYVSFNLVEVEVGNKLSSSDRHTLIKQSYLEK